jgi:hypothetical protein
VYILTHDVFFEHDGKIRVVAIRHRIGIENFLDASFHSAFHLFSSDLLERAYCVCNLTAVSIIVRRAMTTVGSFLRSLLFVPCHLGELWSILESRVIVSLGQAY